MSIEANMETLFTQSSHISDNSEDPTQPHTRSTQLQTTYTPTKNSKNVIAVNFNEKFVCFVGDTFKHVISPAVPAENNITDINNNNEVSDDECDKLVQFITEQKIKTVWSPDGVKLPDIVPDKAEIVYIFSDFENTNFYQLSDQGMPCITTNVIYACMKRSVDIPYLTRPMLNLHMYGKTVVFTGFHQRDHLDGLVEKVHLLGGCVRKDISVGVTHLVALSVLGTKYQLALSFGISTMSEKWVEKLFDKKNEMIDIDSEEFSEPTLRPFTGLVLIFRGISEEDSLQMVEAAEKNGALIHKGDGFNHENGLRVTHCVIGDVPQDQISLIPSRIRLVSQDWLWETIVMDFCADDSLYTRREKRKHSTRHKHNIKKRKRFRNSNVSTSLHEASVVTLSPSTPLVDQPSPSSTKSTEDASRFHIASELLQTEDNFVHLLDVIVNSFKKQIENPNQRCGPILTPEYSKEIFGNLEDIFAVHTHFKMELESITEDWNPGISIGPVILHHADKFSRVYPPFVNFFEQSKAALEKYRKEFPRFHAFLKVAEAKPECLRQPLNELLIQPVQRIPRVILLLQELQKHTHPEHADCSSLQEAVEKLKRVMEHINEDKRKTENQMLLFNIAREVENFPPDLLASHRQLIMKLDIVEPLIDIAPNATNNNTVYTLFLFNDYIEIAKNRCGNGKKLANGKVKYKHIKYFRLSFVQAIVDVVDSEDSEPMHAFAILDGVHGSIIIYSIHKCEITKEEFLQVLLKCVIDTRMLGELEENKDILIRFTKEQLYSSVANESQTSRSLAAPSPFKHNLKKMFDRTKKVHRVFSQKLERSKQQKRTRSKIGQIGTLESIEDSDSNTPHLIQQHPITYKSSTVSINSGFSTNTLNAMGRLEFDKEFDLNDSIVSLAPNLNMEDAVPSCKRRPYTSNTTNNRQAMGTSTPINIAPTKTVTPASNINNNKNIDTNEIKSIKHNSSARTTQL